MVVDQLLAIELWVPDVVLRSNTIKMIVVWLCLPGLPIELWPPRRLLSIVEEAGNKMAINDFTYQHKKTEFVRIWEEIDFSLP